MGWKTIGHIEENGYNRRVAYDTDSGKVERTFGTEKSYSDSKPTNRDVGHARNEAEAISKASRDLHSTFKK